MEELLKKKIKEGLIYNGLEIVDYKIEKNNGRYNVCLISEGIETWLMSVDPLFIELLDDVT